MCCAQLINTTHWCTRPFKISWICSLIALYCAQLINTSHTMITPDLHLEPLYYGHLLALLLMPVQWTLELAFKLANVMVSSHIFLFVPDMIQNLFSLHWNITLYLNCKEWYEVRAHVNSTWFWGSQDNVPLAKLLNYQIRYMHYLHTYSWNKIVDVSVVSILCEFLCFVTVFFFVPARYK